MNSSYPLNDTLKNIESYDLHKDDYSKLHFEIYDALAYLKRNKEKATKPHRHNFFQLIYFRNKGRHYIDYEVIKHPGNTFFFLNKNQVHFFCPEASNEGSLIHFDEFFLEGSFPDFIKRFSISLFNGINRNYVFLSPTEAERIGRIISFIKEELLAKDYFYQEQVYHSFLSILFLIERNNKKQVGQGPVLEKDYALAIAFNDLVNRYVNKFMGIDEFAARLNINRKKLNAVSKKYFLTTPGNHIKQRKILEAKRMLANQQYSIKEIAYSTGFDQPTYFTKYFKKATGFTPKEFQNLIL